MKPTDINSDLSKGVLDELFLYDPNTGDLIYKIRRGTRGLKGSVAGCINKESGYRVVVINERIYYAHRLIWLIMTGDWPQNEIDHKNTNPLDNRWSNLREATSSQNKFNLSMSRRNKSGVKGIYLRDKKWETSIKVNGKYIYLGSYSDKNRAITARKNAEVKYFKEFMKV